MVTSSSPRPAGRRIGLESPGTARANLDDRPPPDGGDALPLPVYRITPPYDLPQRVTRPSRLQPGRLAPGTVVAVASTRPDRDWPTLRQLLPWLRTRCPSAAAVLQVPKGVDPEIVHLASRAGSLHVRAVLVEGEGIASALRELLTNPTDLAGEVVDWLPIRGVRPSPKSARCIHHIFEGTPRYKTIGSLLRQLREHPRTVRSWFRTDGLPTPSHWHAAARAVHACLRLQRDRDRPLHRLALEAGYCDYSHLSRQVTRLFGTSPVVVRDALGWEWLLDRWLERESARGSRPLGVRLPRRV